MKKLREHVRIKVLGWDQHLQHILSKIVLSARDFLNPKGLSLSGQLRVLSFCPFVVLHGQSSHVVCIHKNHGKNLR